MNESSAFPLNESKGDSFPDRFRQLTFKAGPYLQNRVLLLSINPVKRTLVEELTRSIMVSEPRSTSMFFDPASVGEWSHAFTVRSSGSSLPQTMFQQHSRARASCDVEA
jgi:hypothetical protein